MAAGDLPRGHGSRQPLNILLIAYEFPPSPSPQSLRWAYLVRGLAARGHRIHALVPEHPGSGEGLPQLPDGVIIHRTFAGPGMGLLNLLAKGRRVEAARRAPRGDSCPKPEPTRDDAGASPSEELNWKGHLHHAVSGCRTRVFHALHRLIGIGFFPDGRAEWYPWARRKLLRLLEDSTIDIVISSHEPATTLSLGLLASRKGYPWIADLGDPVLAPYTPRRWRNRAMALEREVCAEADLVTVTTSAVAQALAGRHPGQGDKLMLLTQGFDGSSPSPGRRAEFSGDRVLELLYTGSLYSFRRIGPLLEAVENVPGVRLNIASISVPDDVLAASRRTPSVRLLGFLPHAEAIQWQKCCDVLVNLANDDACQVPGKFYEYLGAGRPILHLGDGGDAAAELVLGVSRGWVCRPDRDELERILRRLLTDGREGRFARSFDLSTDAVCDYDWAAISTRLNTRMTNLIVEHGTK